MPTSVCHSHQIYFFVLYLEHPLRILLHIILDTTTRQLVYIAIVSHRWLTPPLPPPTHIVHTRGDLMVSIQYEGIEHLSCLDPLISAQERRQIEDLIQMELDRHQQHSPRDQEHTTQTPRPAGLDIPPLSSLLIAKLVEQLEDAGEEFDDEEFSLGAIDMGAYDNPDYVGLSHAMIDDNNIGVRHENLEGLRYGCELYLDGLMQLDAQLDSAIGEKRKQVDELELLRKKRATELKRAKHYLDDRWRDGVHSVVEVASTNKNSSSWSGSVP